MLPFAPDLQAVAFDFGNTLVEFGPRQVQAVITPLVDFLARWGPADAQLIRAVNDRQMLAPYTNDFRESDMTEACAELLREAMGLDPTPRQVEALVQHRRESFIGVVAPPEPADSPDGVPRLLEKLRARYRLAVVSNYLCGPSIRQSLQRLGWDHFFSAVVVSGDPGVGRIKPHPLPFQTMLAQLGVAPERCVFVGDNWLADIQGAKRHGLRAVFTTQYVPYEKMRTPQPGDAPPDATITRLTELQSLLL